MRLDPGTGSGVLVLASDGLWDVTDAAAVADVVMRFLPDGPQAGPVVICVRCTTNHCMSTSVHLLLLHAARRCRRCPHRRHWLDSLASGQLQSPGMCMSCRRPQRRCCNWRMRSAAAMMCPWCCCMCSHEQISWSRATGTC